MIIGIIVGLSLFYILDYEYTKPNLKINLYQNDPLVTIEEIKSDKTLPEEDRIALINETSDQLNHNWKDELFFTLSNSNKGIAMVKTIYLKILDYKKIDKCLMSGHAYALSKTYAFNVDVNKRSKVITLNEFSFSSDVQDYKKGNLSILKLVYREGDADNFYIGFYYDFFNRTISESYLINVNVVWCDLNDCKEKVLSSKPIAIEFLKSCNPEMDYGNFG